MARNDRTVPVSDVLGNPEGKGVYRPVSEVAVGDDIEEGLGRIFAQPETRNIFSHQYERGRPLVKLVTAQGEYARGVMFGSEAALTDLRAEQAYGYKHGDRHASCHIETGPISSGDQQQRRIE